MINDPGLKQFEDRAKSVLGTSPQSISKIETIKAIQQELESKLFDLMIIAQNGEKITQETFNELFGIPLNELNESLTDEEFEKIFAFSKSQLESMMTYPLDLESQFEKWEDTEAAIPGQSTTLSSL